MILFPVQCLLIFRDSVQKANGWGAHPFKTFQAVDTLFTEDNDGRSYDSGRANKYPDHAHSLGHDASPVVAAVQSDDHSHADEHKKQKLKPQEQ